jgi:hypothetical protein
VRLLRFLLPIVLVAVAAFVAGSAQGKELSPTSRPAPTAQSWKVCLDESIAEYDQRPITAWPALEECFQQP